ncbi:hypothetical protein K491DRAFT_676096 [Lophiostoma macrostomum CBS 122681]|uniref:Uncharacterized protein n=1 Tax=Lophiostoma macrostomum CBS 122681 TaxID=1314788 RepID=A0A6A6TG59_9PLEO|nr:hypothetical protein K491DRAFT_676096 [Lophiostoma macrostomum CBS 122681]
MAKGFDDLVEFLLAEVALCGVPGATSADFRRFVRNFYQKSQAGHGTENEIEPSFYNKVWEWISGQEDVRIWYRGEARSLTLSEFEAFETQEIGTSSDEPTLAQPALEKPSRSPYTRDDLNRLATNNPLFQLSLRQRLNTEGHVVPPRDAAFHVESHEVRSPAPTNQHADAATRVKHAHIPRHNPGGEPAVSGSLPPPEEQKQAERKSGYAGLKVNGTARGPRKVPRGYLLKKPVFEAPDPDITAPRIYVSQNRMWYALTGHAMDYKKVPAMQLMLLSIIAAHGADGILQPDLVKLSLQDKRSVPSRTDELAKHGYIEKIPVNKGMRTSLCIHKKFLKEARFVKGSDRIEDVFQNRTMIISNFVGVLYRVLQEAPLFPMRDLRKKLGLTMQQWHGRAVRNAVYRLEESGFLERKRVYKQSCKNAPPMVLKLLRAPNEDDVKALSAGRRSVAPKATEKILEEDEDGDEVMRDLDLDLESESEEEADDSRIPPQWEPDRLIANLIFDTVFLSGVDGCDSTKIRERAMGRFWKRPAESQLSRLTDHWETSQPLSLRHLSLIRDTTVTSEKKFVHYIYRSHGHFQGAVDIGYVEWEAVSKEASKMASSEKRGRPKGDKEEAVLSEWGFQKIGFGDFYRRVGSSTLAEARAAVAGRRRPKERVWDRMGPERSRQLGKPKTSSPQPLTTTIKERIEPGVETDETPQARLNSAQDRSDWQADADSRPSSRARATPENVNTPGSISSRVRRQSMIPLLSSDQREALGLSPRGRLGADLEEQIKAHRRKTGDPSSLPDVLHKDSAESSKGKYNKKKYRRKPQTEPTLFTKAFRKQHGLPENGRLAQSVIDHYRQLVNGGTAEAANEDSILESPGTLNSERASIPVEETGESHHADTEHLAGLQEPSTPVMAPPSLASVKRKADSSGGRARIPKQRKVDNTLSLPRKAGDSTVSDMPPINVLKQENPAMSSRWSSSPTKTTIPDYPGPYRLASASSLTNAEKAILDKFSERTRPGVYLDPLATRLGEKGRPRKAFLVIFKLSNSSGLLSSWAAENMTSIETHEPLQLSSPDTTNADGSAADVITVTGDDIHSPASASNGRAFSRHPSPRIASPLSIHSVNDSVAKSPLVPIQTPSRSWNAINTHRLQKKTKERPSSLENSSQNPEVSPSEKQSTTVVAQVPSPTPRHAGPFSDEEPGSSEHPVDDTSTIVASTEEDADASHLPKVQNKPRRKEGIFTSRGVVLGRGNIWRLRTSIILDIIQRCNGVFPLNGEIVQPFWTLWEQRAGKNMIKPERSTLTNTINSMIEGENHKIKKIAFRVPNKNGSTTYERFIIAWTSIPPNDPRIREMQINMIKAYPRKYYPEAVRDLCTDPEPESSRKIPLAAVDLSIDPDAVFPRNKKPLKRNPNEASDGDHTPRGKVGYSLLKPRENVCAQGRLRRQRLDTLNDGLKLPQRNHVRIAPRINGRNRDMSLGRDTSPSPYTLSESELESESGSEAESDSSEDIPLAWRRLVRSGNSAVAAQKVLDDMSSSSESQYTSNESTENEGWSERGLKVTHKGAFVHLTVSPPARRMHVMETRMLNPGVRFYPGNGTFSTDTAWKRGPQPTNETSSVAIQPERSNVATVTDTKTFEFVVEKTPWLGRKGLSRKELCADVGATGPATSEIQVQLPAGKRKRVRFTEASIIDEDGDSQGPSKRQRFMLDEYRDDKSSPESDEDSDHAPRKSRKGRPKIGMRSRPGRQLYPEPTLTERLAGLTGDPNDPVYFMPRKIDKGRKWRLNPTLSQKVPRPKRIVRQSYSSGHFPRLCFTLVIACCMSGAGDRMDWDIVQTVYRSELSFSLTKTKGLWQWMQINMAQEVQTLTINFQTAFLEAYAAGKVDSIDNPKTYDWAALVRWAMKTLDLPQSKLPDTKKALSDYSVEEMPHLNFDAVDWSIQSHSYATRAQRALNYTYVSPIHIGPARSLSDDTSRARSWIRSNTATPQELYNSTQAHLKFKEFDTSLLERVVNNMIEDKVLRMRKIRRLLPGRNFEFTVSLAMKYRRMFELDVFTQAASLKASLDCAFANKDPSKRTFTLSRTAPDGMVMGLLSLLNEGRIKLVPKLPPVDNALQAPAPRISIWGFQPCHYASRAIPREQLFWGIEAVPTSTYQFGNPLNPSPSPPTPSHQDSQIPASPELEWKDPLPPPLLGKEDDNALLPIWSSFDGQEVTWPWWYRILNLVMQALMFQPGATLSDIQRHCTSIAAELFEIELVLNWLVDVGAAEVSQHLNANGEVVAVYETLPGFYAVFGKELKCQDQNDWFGEKVKRKKTNEIQIRGKAPSAYSLRYRRVGALLRGETVGNSTEVEDVPSDQEDGEQVDVDAHMADNDTDAEVDANAGTQTVAAAGLDGTHDSDMDGDWDEDAEGEVDDEML